MEHRRLPLCAHNMRCERCGLATKFLAVSPSVVAGVPCDTLLDHQTLFGSSLHTPAREESGYLTSSSRPPDLPELVVRHPLSDHHELSAEVAAISFYKSLANTIGRPHSFNNGRSARGFSVTSVLMSATPAGTDWGSCGFSLRLDSSCDTYHSGTTLELGLTTLSPEAVLQPRLISVGSFGLTEDSLLSVSKCEILHSPNSFAVGVLACS